MVENRNAERALRVKPYVLGKRVIALVARKMPDAPPEMSEMNDAELLDAILEEVDDAEFGEFHAVLVEIDALLRDLIREFGGTPPELV